MAKPCADPRPLVTSTTTDQPGALEAVLRQSSAKTGQATPQGIALGVLVALDEDGQPRVDLPEWGLNALPAAQLVPLGTEHLGQRLAIGFIAGDPSRPIVLGLMLTPGSAGSTTPEAHSRPATLDACVDGERVLIEAQHEIELRCGESAIILQADGRIVLRGNYITSHASATQRILGGSVNVN